MLSRIWVSTGRVAVGEEVELRTDDKSLEDSAVVRDAVLSVVAEAAGSVWGHSFPLVQVDAGLGP